MDSSQKKTRVNASMLPRHQGAAVCLLGIAHSVRKLSKSCSTRVLKTNFLSLEKCNFNCMGSLNLKYQHMYDVQNQLHTYTDII